MNKKYKIKISVLIPCRNEESHIENSIKSIFDFDPPIGGFEVIVIDGMSTDGTRNIILKLIKHYPNLMMIDNPKQTVPHAMNLGINQAKGEYVVRADVRCIHSKSYLNDLIKLSEKTRADNVGGTLEAIGNTYTQKCIAKAYKSPIAVGAALGNWGSTVREVDDVYGGCFKKEFLLKVGCYDEEMIRNQDDELSFRIRKAGGKIIQSGKIRVKYFPRKHFRQLFKQFYQYGFWKVVVIKKHTKQASLRHIAPSMLIIGFLFLGIMSIINIKALYGFLFYSGIYVSSLFLESIRITLKDSIKFSPWGYDINLIDAFRLWSWFFIIFNKHNVKFEIKMGRKLE